MTYKDVDGLEELEDFEAPLPRFAVKAYGIGASGECLIERIAAETEDMAEAESIAEGLYDDPRALGEILAEIAEFGAESLEIAAETLVETEPGELECIGIAYRRRIGLTRERD